MATLHACILGISLLAQSGALSHLLGDPENAVRRDYCTADEGDPATSAIVEAALTPDSGASPRDKATALLIQAGTAIAAQAQDYRDCRRRFQRGGQLFERTIRRHEQSLSRASEGRRSEDARLNQVQERISAQWVADQAGRLAYMHLRTEDRTGASYWAQRRATANAITTDAVSLELMRELLTEFDWIDAHRFGGQTASRAWLLVQHADDVPEFQRQALHRMAGYLDSGGVQRRDYAYLWDRVAVNTGQLQRYGTQPTDSCNQDGTLDLKPVEEPDLLDARRTEMGLGPAEADLARMSAERCGS